MRKLNRPLLLFLLLALAAGALLLLRWRSLPQHAHGEVLLELTNESASRAFFSAEDELACLSTGGELLRIGLDGEERARVSLPAGAGKLKIDELTGTLLISGVREYWLADAQGVVRGHYAELLPSNFLRIEPLHDFLLGSTLRLELVGIAWDGRELFRRQSGGKLFGMPRRLGENYLVSTSDNFTYCLDRQGAVLWEASGQLSDISSAGEVLLQAGNWLIVLDSAGQPLRRLATPGIRSASFGPSGDVSYCQMSGLHWLDAQLQERWVIADDSLVFRDSLNIAPDGHAAYWVLDIGTSASLLRLLRARSLNAAGGIQLRCIDSGGNAVWTYPSPSLSTRLLGSINDGRAVIQDTKRVMIVGLPE